MTSYDYDAPVDEQGRPRPKYYRLREMIGADRGPLPPVPEPIPAADIPPIAMKPYSTLWANLPAPVSSVQPKPMEAFGQYQGIIVYRTRLLGRKSGTLTVTDPHDYALVFLDGAFVGTLDRREGVSSINLPPSRERMPLLDIVVEAMGRINYGPALIDRKGITDRVTLGGMTLMNWEVFNLPMDETSLASLREASVDTARHCVFFRGTFDLDRPADTFLDMSSYRKGIVWVNGHNLGRYWDIGPQKRLYCPAPWLRTGRNDVTVFDFHAVAPAPIAGFRTLEQ